MDTSRKLRFRFDPTINITNMIAAALFIITLAHYGRTAINYLETIDNKVSIMWVDFAKRNPDAVNQLEIIRGR